MSVGSVSVVMSMMKSLHNAWTIVASDTNICRYSTQNN